MSVKTQIVKVGEMAFDLTSVASMHWENKKLFVHLDGGRFVTLVGAGAQALWEAYSGAALDLVTGEVGK